MCAQRLHIIPIPVVVFWGNFLASFLCCPAWSPIAWGICSQYRQVAVHDVCPSVRILDD